MADRMAHPLRVVAHGVRMLPAVGVNDAKRAPDFVEDGHGARRLHDLERQVDLQTTGRAERQTKPACVQGVVEAQVAAPPQLRVR